MTHRPSRVRGLAVVAAVGAALSLTACGSSDVTRPRLEASLAPTFTNLYVHQQTDLLGHPGVTPASVAASASCDKGGPKVADRGHHGEAPDARGAVGHRHPPVMSRRRSDV